ncbi:hypothetical protein E2562_030033 [Oryza meyeriana var. granulata]|uniref:Uncharacterized protein n=1 Tax=Oryza meyeriana var. granulata TaxID=110450 RepID=A0A6G1EBU6_9ORYZ|nr:hypothetical protein E2562_030033 [Oryza meyeriana var. granulata]
MAKLIVARHIAMLRHGHGLDRAWQPTVRARRLAWMRPWHRRELDARGTRHDGCSDGADTVSACNAEIPWCGWRSQPVEQGPQPRCAASAVPSAGVALAASVASVARHGTHGRRSARGW